MARLERVTDHDEYPSQQLPARPTYRTAGLGAHGKCDLDQIFQSHWYEAETCGPEDAEDDVGRHNGARRRRPDECQVGDCDYGDEGFDEGEVGFGSIDDRGGDGCCDEADYDE